MQAVSKSPRLIEIYRNERLDLDIARLVQSDPFGEVNHLIPSGILSLLVVSYHGGVSPYYMILLTLLMCTTGGITSDRLWAGR